MAEYIAVDNQNLSLENPIIFNASIPCTKGYVYHEDGSGIFILRGITNNCFARYEVTFSGNISIIAGGEITPIAIGITENGEILPQSVAISSPSIDEEYGNVISTATITVPKGCCFTVALRYVSGITDGTTTPTPAINVRNGSVRITRTA